MNKFKVPEFVSQRRSVRSFTDQPVEQSLLESVVQASALAPAPHHTTPWKWLQLKRSTRARLSARMSTAWTKDLLSDGYSPEEASGIIERAETRLLNAPVALLGCFTMRNAHQYPDKRRQQAEETLMRLALGAGAQNLMLAAADHGLGSCWIAAPPFCRDLISQELASEPLWIPDILILLGWPDPAAQPQDRPPVDISNLLFEV